MNLLLKVKSGIALMLGILFLVAITPTYLGTVGILAAVLSLREQGRGYGYQVWIAFDKFWNAVLGGNHWETISSRLGKSVYHQHRPVFWIREADRLVAFLLDQVDRDHCRNSIDWDV